MNDNYGLIPIMTQKGIDRYVSEGVPAGDFLKAVFENNLMNAFDRADASNLAVMDTIVTYIYNKCPMGCWGSKEIVNKWVKAGGLNGLMSKEKPNK